MRGTITNMFDYWAYLVVHLFLLNSSTNELGIGPYQFATDGSPEELFAAGYEGAGEQDRRRGFVKQFESSIVNFDLIHLGDELEGWQPIVENISHCAGKVCMVCGYSRILEQVFRSEVSTLVLQLPTDASFPSIRRRQNLFSQLFDWAKSQNNLSLTRNTIPPLLLKLPLLLPSFSFRTFLTCSEVQIFDWQHFRFKKTLFPCKKSFSFWSSRFTEFYLIWSTIQQLTTYVYLASYCCDLHFFRRLTLLLSTLSPSFLLDFSTFLRQKQVGERVKELRGMYNRVFCALMISCDGARRTSGKLRWGCGPA